MNARDSAVALQHLAEALSRHVREAHARSDEGVHDLRVTCRRLETRLRLWAHRGDTQRLRRRVRALRRQVGGARESEVVAALLRAGTFGARVIPQRLRRRWVARLEREAIAVVLPSVERVDQIAAAVRRWAAILADSHGRANRARRRLRVWRRRATRALESSLRRADPAALHEARLTIKRWRYAEEAIGSAAAARVARAKRWQRALGSLNDRAMLASFVAAQGAEGAVHAPELERLRRVALRSLRRRLASNGSTRRVR